MNICTHTWIYLTLIYLTLIDDKSKTTIKRELLLLFGSGSLR
jgi:hypothetical protein